MEKLILDRYGEDLQNTDPQEYCFQLDAVNEERRRELLKHKLLEELHEYYSTGNEEELRDLIQICRILLGEAEDVFSQGFVLTDEQG